MAASRSNGSKPADKDAQLAYKGAVDDLVNTMIAGRLKKGEHVSDQILSIAHDHWKTVKKVKKDLRKKLFKRLHEEVDRFRKAHLDFEALNTLTSDLGKAFGQNDS